MVSNTRPNAVSAKTAIKIIAPTRLLVRQFNDGANDAPHQSFRYFAKKPVSCRPFGNETYYVKVDTSLPERAQRKWEKRASDNGEE